MVVVNVLVACDTVECGYRVVTLDDGRTAFVWGNVRAHVGDELPAELAAAPTAENGIELYASEEEAVGAYRRCAGALQQVGSRAAVEMLEVVDGRL